MQQGQSDHTTGMNNILKLLSAEILLLQSVCMEVYLQHTPTIDPTHTLALLALY